MIFKLFELDFALSCEISPCFPFSVENDILEDMLLSVSIEIKMLYTYQKDLLLETQLLLKILEVEFSSLRLPSQSTHLLQGKTRGENTFM